MEEKLLVEKKRTAVVESEAVVGEYLYKVSHEFMNSTLLRLGCSVVEEETNTMIGYMSYNTSSKKINLDFPADADFNTHAEVFRGIIAEVQEALEE